LLSRLDPSIPVAALPSFAFLIVAETCLMLWDLRQSELEKKSATVRTPHARAPDSRTGMATPLTHGRSTA
jgi:hypothetical protein